MEKLTIQIFNDGFWHDAAELVFANPERGRQGSAVLGYDGDYSVEWMYRDDEFSCSINLPIELAYTYSSKQWFAFLDDIMPAGASRRYWINQLGLQSMSASEQDYILLKNGTIAPVGNMRIKEALPELHPDSQLTNIRFALQDVIERDSSFLEYAQQMGAAAGGATGAGGEAPKLLLCCSSHDEIWIDTFQNDINNQDTHYLVKFPRGKRTPIDCDILRAEYYFYQELASIGINTINTEKMKLLEGEHYPSLWLPRFDIDFIESKRVQYGLESVYSVMDAASGSHLNHFDVIRTLSRKLVSQYRVRELGQPLNVEALVIEMVQRDLLNVAFGNSDNHGRNTALIKRLEGIWLSPIYDFAPMKADPEGIVRVTQWGSPYEEGGNFNWQAIIAELSDLADPTHVFLAFQQTAQKLIGLKPRLKTRGVPDSILDMPGMAFDYLDEKLKRWAQL
ncbi:type II toxin-antitoxin system HipA family toxin [Yersinia mollaretii]|uniref:DNA-binding transcriptional regulator n=1 Tax=Yersinia mollaretii TaxID=33060 RepID=A0AA36LQU9_YERMO|nr:HipA domain-containing protein [Yersinia mollaretii]MDA5527648.1 HipA domain-containing protein [Yersinia mollaretii]MDA5533448.1 HipA domain-containing protein [Yersinia mollaretii]MDR7875596.1 HipA domain-containing protein [Yersinia mollaretii]NIL01381.1 type II toxin-antitoxin system HipA family toxin [Yersinia mollaretii]PHZ30643.1 type II toxin-antitoxin system HipA family toxin [Yersinia mollaretii]